ASKCHAELVSASGSEPYLVLLRGQILKQVQDDHLLWAIVICYIEEQNLRYQSYQRTMPGLALISTMHALSQ
ncbi:MAG: hypothetical protein J6L60_09085, partial [Bacteroidaceae bacterium]|nr:hypothetical protein [Bacteroidaceae bacterium]